MAERRDKPDGRDTADEFGTLDLAPPLRPEAMETIAPSSPAGTTPGDTPPADIYATMAREIPAGDAGATIANMPPAPAVAGLPFDRVGEYDILDKIGHGGMGLVLKARSRRLKRIVALKLIKVGQLAEEQEVARFMVEARAAAHLEHPNIVGVYDVGEHAGSPFFTMEYVEGQSLHKLISERPLQPQRAAIIIRKLALAVDYAHNAGILHRDLKPQNILLDKYEEPKITDFGLATNAQENSQLTATGTVLGTPSYMPPEQARGKHEEMGKWSDVYSLGATLYETLVGRPPFTAATLGETLQQVMTVDPVSPRRLNPAIPRDVETICLKCLEKSPARRYQTAGELAEELQRFLEDRPILARPTATWEKVIRWCRRNPAWAGSIAIVSVALMVSFVGLWVGRNQALEGERKATAALHEADETNQAAMKMVDQLLVRISEETLFNQPGMQPITADIYGKALKEYEQLLPKLEKNQRLPIDIAMVRFQMGFVTKNLGKPKEALSLMETAAESLDKLYQADPQNIQLLEELSKMKTQIGTLHFEQQRFPEAAGPLQDASTLRRLLVELKPRDIVAGQLLANSEMNLGLLEESLGHSPMALEQYQAAQRRRNGLLQREPANVGVQRDLAKGFDNLGVFFLSQRKLVEAETAAGQARDVFLLLTQRKGRSLDDLYALAMCWQRLGDIAFVRNGDKDLALAGERYYEGLRVSDELVVGNVGVVEYRGTMAGMQLNLARVRELQKESAEAFDYLISAFYEFQALQSVKISHQRDYVMTFRELLRLRQWKKLSEQELKQMNVCLTAAAKDYGQPWVDTLIEQAAAAPEFPAIPKPEEIGVSRGGKSQ